MMWSVIRVQGWEEIRVRARDGVPDAVIGERVDWPFSDRALREKHLGRRHLKCSFD